VEKHLTIGVAGHVDHGKTALVKCLTGIDTDRLKEEKQRGVSIEPGIALLSLPSGKQLALMDVPGHSDYLKNTIRGLSSVDLAILVVAADDGVMPQTLDHLEVLKVLRAKSGLVVLSKTDLVDEETIELAELEIREAVRGSFLEDKPVIPFSAVIQRGLPDILSALEKETKKAQGKSIKSPFRLWIDQARHFPGFGTVVSGTVQSGIIRQDDTLQLLPGGKETKVRFLEVHHQKVSQAMAGQRVGINLQKVSLQEVSLGMVLSEPGALQPAFFLNAELSLLNKAARPLLDRQRIKLYIGTGLFQAMVIMMNGSRLDPGQTGLVQFRLQEPLAVLPKDPFVISPMNTNTVIGGGIILETTKEKYRLVKTEKMVGYLAPLLQGDQETVIQKWFERFPDRTISVKEMTFKTGFSEESLIKTLTDWAKAGRLIDLGDGKFFPKERCETLKKKLIEEAATIFNRDAFKLSVAAEELRCRLDTFLEDILFESLLQSVIKAGRLIKLDGLYRIPNLSGRLSRKQEKLTERLLDYARNLKYESFSAGYFCKVFQDRLEQKEVQKLLDHLHARKRLIRLNNNRFLTPEALEEIKDKVKEVVQVKGNFSIGDIKEVFGYGRTGGIPILEHLDTIGFTWRIGDVRVLTEKNPVAEKENP
jgi:selenocysteine-specific elongation factor